MLGPNSGSHPNGLSLHSSPGNRFSPNNNSRGSRLSLNSSSPDSKLSLSSSLNLNSSSALSSPNNNSSELNNLSAPSSSNKRSRSKTPNPNEPSNPRELSSQANRRSLSGKTPSSGNPERRIETTRLPSGPLNKLRTGSNKTDGASMGAGKAARASSSPGPQTGPGIIAVGASGEVMAVTTFRRITSASISGSETFFASAHSLTS